MRAGEPVRSAADLPVKVTLATFAGAESALFVGDLATVAAELERLRSSA